MSRSASGSRNDLFSESWAPTMDPPKPLGLRVDSSEASTQYGAWSASVKRHENAVASSSGSQPMPSMTKTSSFFDISYPPPVPPMRTAPTPPPPPPSRAPAPAPLQLAHPTASSNASASKLSPLHFSPSLPSSSAFPSDWQPTLPVFDDVELRLQPTSTYLLGEGQHARVFLAGYKTKGKGKEGEEPSVWQLCAAKRLAADFESQTLGLREAFFLHRLRADKDASPPDGEVFVVKLIAVKEDTDRHAGGHGRSASDALVGTPLSTPTPRLTGSQTPLSVSSHPASRLRSSTVAASSSKPYLSGKQVTYSIPPSPLALPSVASNPSLPSLFLFASEVPATSSRLVLLLEHCPLGTVDRMLRTSASLVGTQLWESWAQQAISAVHWVHSHGIVHADIKPGNLLLTEDLRIRLSDFGSSLLIHPEHPPSDGIGLGTLPYSSPELLNTARPFSFPTDIFSLGATLYQCITGREPYKGLRTVETMHHVRKGLFWAYEERERVSRIGSAADGRHRSLSASWQTPPYVSAAPTRSPSPSTLGVNHAGAGVRRAVSLRAPSSQPLTPANHHALRPAMVRQPSAESVKASADLVGQNSESPAGIKLWALYAHADQAQSNIGRDAIEALLGDSDLKRSPITPTRIRAADIPTISIAARVPHPSSPDSTPTPPPTKYRFPQAYEDGFPPMCFLDGDTVVGESHRKLLWRMLRPEPEQRPTAAELLRIIKTL